MKTIICNVFYLFVFSLMSCTTDTKKQTAAAPTTGIANIKLKEINGKSIDVGEYKGKTVFINVWATWCKPCIIEMPTIESVQKKLVNANIVFLLASNEEPEQIKNFSKKHAFKFHYVYLENMEAMKIQALPTTLIFNPEGKLQFSEAGFRKWDDADNIELITKIMNSHEK